MAFRVIPVIDFNAYSLEKEGASHEELQALSEDICNAFSTVGFCYLKNHGLPQETIDSLQGRFHEFFKLDKEAKLRHVSQTGSPTFTGYRPLESVSNNKGRPARNMLECFNVRYGKTKLPEEIPQMVEEFERFSKLVSELVSRVLKTILLKFSEEDKQLILESHKALLNPEHPECCLMLRANFYPEVKHSDVKAGQLRFHEHADHGTLTIVFQDDVTGLEVKTRDGEYIPVNHIPGTAVLNLGEMMQRWTADKLIAAKHRVVIPDGMTEAKDRQSLAVFCSPDTGTEIRCLDGSDRYEPVIWQQYLEEQMKQPPTE